MICMGFVGTSWSPSLHGLALLLFPTVFPPGGLPCPSETHCTIPTSALVFEGNNPLDESGSLEIQCYASHVKGV